mmetsp:Transcript_15644/g.28464  ORF Transcript_15644/g.28464 Transcript_15644/m.28464 type:complete len:326 (+) Transcript_15644:325-1302(+)
MFQSPLFDSKPKTACEESSESQKRSSNLLLGQMEDDSQEEEIIFENFYETRPPARHKEQALNLVDSMQASTPEKRPINISTEIRPPSRHKTPPKAVGLDLPPGKGGQKIEIEKMFSSASLNGTFDEDFYTEVESPLLRTLPNASEPLKQEHPKSSNYRSRSKARKKSKSCRNSKKNTEINKMLKAWEPETDSVRTCETSQVETNSVRTAKVGETRKEGAFKGRVWSAITQQKPLADIPITLNKRSKHSSFMAVKRQSLESAKEMREESREKTSEQRPCNPDANHYKIKRKIKKASPTVGSKTLPFISSLDAEFLGLFSCDEFNIH